MESSNISIKVYDLYGRLIDNIHNGLIEKDIKYNFEYKPNNSISVGIYIVRFEMNNESVFIKN